MVVGMATASNAGWIQAAVGRGERASPGWCDRGRVRGRAAKRGGRCGGPAGTGARARPARGRLPGTGEAGIRPVKQPVRVVDVLVLIGGKVPGGASIVGDLRLAARPAAMAE